jgi:HAD superfamily hydrolase (TIGR01509 family)
MKTHNDFSGYLFDMDGVLIDSMPQHNMAFILALKHYDLALGDVEIAGKSTMSVIEEVQQNNQSVDAPLLELVSLKQSIARDLIFAEGKKVLVPNVDEVLSRLSSKSKIGICTSGSKASLEYFLSLLSTDIKFDALMCVADVEFAKPNPEIYLKGASKMDIATNEVLVIEDSLSGINAGLAAGCKVAQIGGAVLDESIVTNRLFRINSLNDLLIEANGLGS